LNKRFSVERTLLFWGAEFVGAGVGATIGEVFGYWEAGFVLGLMAGGLAFIFLSSRAPLDSD
jgi:hypothetical protein